MVYHLFSYFYWFWLYRPKRKSGNRGVCRILVTTVYSERKSMSHPWPFIGVKWFFLEDMVEGKSAVTPLISLDSNRA